MQGTMGQIVINNSRVFVILYFVKSRYTKITSNALIGYSYPIFHSGIFTKTILIKLVCKEMKHNSLQTSQNPKT